MTSVASETVLAAAPPTNARRVSLVLPEWFCLCFIVYPHEMAGRDVCRG